MNDYKPSLIHSSPVGHEWGELDFFMASFSPRLEGPFLEASIDAAYKQRLLRILHQWQPTATAN